MWQALGSLTPASVWQSLPETTDSTLFKITQRWGNQFPGVGNIKFAFNLDGLIFEGGTPLVELNTEVIQIVKLAVPKAFNSMGFSGRRLAIKFGEDTRLWARLPGTIEVEQWDGPDDSDDTIDGGVY